MLCSISFDINPFIAAFDILCFVYISVNTVYFNFTGRGEMELAKNCKRAWFMAFCWCLCSVLKDFVILGR